MKLLITLGTIYLVFLLAGIVISLFIVGFCEYTLWKENKERDSVKVEIAEED